MTRVLHIRSSAGFFGAERVLTTLLPALRQTGVEARLVLLEHPAGRHMELLERAREAGVDAVAVPCHGRISPSAARAVRTEARRFGAELIHTHDYKSHFYGWIAAGSTGAGRLPLVTTLHGWTGSSARLNAYRKLEPLVLRTFAAVVTVSTEMAEQLNHPHLHTIGNGVDLTRFRPDRPGTGRAGFGFSPDTFLFGTVARLTREKGHADLIEAFATVAQQVPEAGLLIVGEGPEQTALEALAKKRGCARDICFAGGRGNVESLLHDLDCYVSPSHTEGMPMILLEAMASGVAVIATRVGAVPDLLADGAGVLVEPRRKEELATQMVRAATGDLPLDRVAQMALRRCEMAYGVERQAGGYADLYREVLDCKSPLAGGTEAEHPKEAAR